MTSIRFVRLWFALVAIVLVGGCSGYKFAERETYPVSGSASYRGEPIAGGTVTLHPVSPVDDGKPFVIPKAVVKPDGSFSFTTYRSNDGAPLGDYMVAFSWKGILEDVNADDAEEMDEQLPEEYLDPKTSGVRVTIAKGDNTLPKFELN
ncbi:MAG TPA: hypothetical protein PKD64_07330 [Pirellulaceae bacterium]|nr:hypothetical protein [Pirellulaceae bacterium]HMO91997.1 hypothetical protein [Pirellulaceae bacterium]HMP68796.1 hypothetical protein [Pirellulaceae bacterium]